MSPRLLGQWQELNLNPYLDACSVLSHKGNARRAHPRLSGRKGHSLALDTIFLFFFNWHFYYVQFFFLTGKAFIQKQDRIFYMKPFLQKAVSSYRAGPSQGKICFVSVFSLSLGINLSGPLAQVPIRRRWRQVTLTATLPPLGAAARGLTLLVFMRYEGEAQNGDGHVAPKGRKSTQSRPSRPKTTFFFFSFSDITCDIRGGNADKIFILGKL